MTDPVHQPVPQPVAPIRVMVVDDQELFRAGIGMVVRSQPDMLLVGQAGDGQEAIAVAEQCSPEVILMDLKMPVLNGIAATEQILQRSAGQPRIIALTTYNRDQAVVEVVQAGASGFLLKSSEPEFLLAAIRTVHSGYAVIAPSTVHDFFQHAARTVPVVGPDFSVLAELSTRERDVFLLAAKALSNSEIAESLFVSEATVKSHLRSVLHKLQLRSRLQLIGFAYQHRILGPAAGPDSKRESWCP